tara:strand:+ start:1536 stop:1895 length:360 start_codon:yes stop_codon:yes gene_type:complete
MLLGEYQSIHEKTISRQLIRNLDCDCDDWVGDTDGKSSIASRRLPPRDEQLEILRHYIEVIELKAYDLKGKSGTYALRLFPEVSPDRGFDLGEEGIETPPFSQKRQAGPIPMQESTPMC